MSIAPFTMNFIVAAIIVLVLYIVYHLLIAPRFNPLHNLSGPPVRTWFGNHLSAVLEYVVRSIFAVNPALTTTQPRHISQST